MSGNPRVLLVTGDQQRHRHVAAVVSEELELAGVVSEAKAAPQVSNGTINDPLIASHFTARDQAEMALLRNVPRFPDVPLLRVPTGLLNTMAVYQWVVDLAPDAVLLYGSGLVKEPLLSVTPGRMLNLHLGLSPWYRGAGTNFWPFVFGEPECVGATLHLAVEKVDAGPIFAQVRPAWSPEDGIHEAGTKSLIAAAEILPQITRVLLTGNLRGYRQDMNVGRVFRQKDFNAEALQMAHSNLNNRLIPAYLQERSARDDRFPLVEQDFIQKGCAG